MEILFGTSLFSCPGFSNDALTGGVREVQVREKHFLLQKSIQDSHNIIRQYNSKDNEGQVQIEFSESGQGMIAFKCLTSNSTIFFLKIYTFRLTFGQIAWGRWRARPWRSLQDIRCLRLALVALATREALLCKKYSITINPKHFNCIKGVKL